MKLNSRKTKQSTHVNFDGGKSYNLKDPFTRLRMVCASCFFGEPQYYKQEKDNKKPKALSEKIYDALEDYVPVFDDLWQKLSPSQTIEKAIDECLDKDPEDTLKIAVALRNEDYMRITPQVILVRAAMHPKTRGTGIIRYFADEICKRGDEPMVCFSYFRKAFPGQKFPQNLKKALRDILESFDDYVISKYKLEKNEVTMKDIIKYTHAYSNSIKKLFEGKQKQTEKIWNSIVSNSKEKDNKKTWEKALSKMPHMALLRNLRNLEKNGIAPEKWKDNLLKGVKFGKQFPFRYWSAFNAVSDEKTKDIVEEAMELSFDNVPTFKGKTLCLSDNSGSARGTTTSELGTVQISTIGNLSSIVVCKKSDDADFVVFGDKAIKIPCRKKSSTFDILKEANEAPVGGATEAGLWIWLRNAIDKKIHYDRIFVFSDMQAGYGQLYGSYNVIRSNKASQTCGHIYISVSSLIREYREKVNPNCSLFLIQTAGYTDTIMPEFYDNTFIIGGWSQGVIRFAQEMEKIFQ